MSKCPNCGYESDSENKFCPKCGQKQTIRCPKCGNETSSENDFCPECGNKLSDNQEDYNKSDTTTKIDPSQYNVYGKQKKKDKPKRGCGIGCLIFIIFIVIASVGGYQSNKLENSSTTNVSGNSSIDRNTKQNIENIFKQCGFTKIKEINHDELLDNAHFQGEKGYRVSANISSVDNFKNIILYLNSDNTVYSVRYADHDLYINGKVNAKITDYELTTDDASKYMIVCKEAVEKVLKSHSTAKFPNFLDWNIAKKDGQVVVAAYVDSQNGFGATVRSQFQFTFDSNNNVKSFIFDGKEYMN